MAKLETSHAWDAFRDEIDAAVAGRPRFPYGSAFVATDAPDAGRTIARYHDEGVPVVLVDADGTHRLLPGASAKTDSIYPETLRVRAPAEADLPIKSETMHARPDPADPHQAVLVNAPFYVDWLNYGDLVRVGEEDEAGVRPITEVLTASGHVRVMVVTGGYSIRALNKDLHSRFPAYALRTEGDGDRMLSVSVHPDLDPEKVAEAIVAWLDEQGAEPDDENVALSPILETRLGPVDWPEPDL
jgi:Domain of unknown function (DUF4265)